jgi:Tol biopolymer transport system component
MRSRTKRIHLSAVAGAAAIVAASAAAVPAQAAFPGGNGRVAFANQTFDASGRLVRSNIETVNPDGTARALFRTCRRTRSCQSGSPSWSPSGAMLAFATQTRLGTARADGSDVDRFRRRTLHDGEPAWAPDGSRLAFTGQPRSADPVNVFILGCGSCAVGELTFRGGSQPAWSSTDRVAFTRRGNIYTMRSDAKRAKRLTFKGGTQADWSPHASKLAFVRKGNVYIVRRTGKGLKKITGKGGTDPAWSPDGKQLAFVRSGSVYVVGTDKRGLRQLTAPQPLVPLAAGESVRLASPSWQPTH